MAILIVWVIIGFITTVWLLLPEDDEEELGNEIDFLFYPFAILVCTGLWPAIWFVAYSSEEEEITRQ